MYRLDATCPHKTPTTRQQQQQSFHRNIMPFGVPECDYVPSLRMFRVRKVIGKQFFAGGFGMTLSFSNKNEKGDSCSFKNQQSAEYLFIEEVLFLLERGVLQVYSERGELLHLQRVYEMLETTRVPISIYLTYAHLRRQDYRVLRHVPDDASMTTNDSSKEARRTMVLTTLNQDASSIAFDVYRPNTHFKRTDPGIPHLQVAVASFQLPFLTFIQLQSLIQKIGNVPLKIATVSDSGVVVMFAISSVGVPTIITNNHDDYDSTSTENENDCEKEMNEYNSTE
jgi:hypothetical protein